MIHFKMTEKKRRKQNKKMIQHHNLNWDTQVTKSGVLQKHQNANRYVFHGGRDASLRK